MNSEWQSLQPQTQQELKNTMNAMQPPQSIEEIKAGLETTEKGGVRQSIRNCLTVFQRDPLLSGAIAYNILTDRKDIIKPIGFHRESTALNDTDMKYLLLYLEETYGLTNEKKIDNAIGIVANENKYHPIRDYLSSLVWDGTERIRFCLRHFLGADADDYTYEALKLFLLGAISRAFQPGCKFEIMLETVYDFLRPREQLAILHAVVQVDAHDPAADTDADAVIACCGCRSLKGCEGGRDFYIGSACGTGCIRHLGFVTAPHFVLPTAELAVVLEKLRYFF